MLSAGQFGGGDKMVHLAMVTTRQRLQGAGLINDDIFQREQSVRVFTEEGFAFSQDNMS